jgi:hypothetical protein
MLRPSDTNLSIGGQCVSRTVWVFPLLKLIPNPVVCSANPICCVPGIAGYVVMATCFSPVNERYLFVLSIYSPSSNFANHTDLINYKKR